MHHRLAPVGRAPGTLGASQQAIAGGAEADGGGGAGGGGGGATHDISRVQQLAHLQALRRRDTREGEGQSVSRTAGIRTVAKVTTTLPETSH